MKEILKKINDIVADDSRSINERIDLLITYHKSMKPYSDESMNAAVYVYEAVRKLLLTDNYEGCYDLDLIMCNCMLAEAYSQQQKQWLVTPLATHTCDTLLGRIVDDEETRQTIVAVLSRLCYLLKGTGHARLMMKLLNMKYNFEKESATPNENILNDCAEQLVMYATLSHCDTWYAPLCDEIDALLGKDAVREIKENPREGMLNIDPVEYSEAYEAVVDKVDAEVSEQMGEKNYSMGMCFEIWSLKKSILASKYNIEWKSPSAMNPGVMFD